MNGTVFFGANTGFGENGIVSGTTALHHNAYGGGNTDFSVNSISAKTGPYLTAAQAAGSEAGSVSLSSNPFTNAAAGDFHTTGVDTAVFGLVRFPTYQTFNTSPS